MVQPLLIRVSMGVMAMESCSRVLRATELKTHHQRHFSVTAKTPFFLLGEKAFPFCKGFG